MKGWQVEAMKAVWASPNGVNNRIVHQKVRQVPKRENISRSFIINFLDDMRETGALRGEEVMGRGGNQWVYYPKPDEAGFRRFIVEKMIDCLMCSFPEETRDAIRQLSL